MSLARMLIAFALLVSAVLTDHAVAADRTLAVDAVELVAGRDVKGQESLRVDREGITYLFANAANKAAFERDPARYEVADGGACGSMGPLSGLCGASRYAVHEGRIYLFASDGCRATFLRDPKRCIETAQAPPSGSKEASAKGLALVDQVIAWAGGDQAIRKTATYRERVAKTAYSGDRDWRVERSVAIEFPGRYAERESWDESWWTTVSTPTGGVTASSNGREPMAESRRRAFDRWMARMPLVILKARHQPGFVAVADGAGTEAGVEVDYVRVGWQGATSRLGVERSTGRLVSLAFRGRDGTSFVGESVRTFTAYTTSGGVTLPSAWTVRFDGEENPSLTVTLTSLEVGATLTPADFLADE